MLWGPGDLVPRIGHWDSYMLGQVGRKLLEGLSSISLGTEFLRQNI
jgi:hypothetical protein